MHALVNGSICRHPGIRWGGGGFFFLFIFLVSDFFIYLGSFLNLFR